MSKQLPIFEIEVAKRTADRVRRVSKDFEIVSWRLDSAMRNLRVAQLHGFEPGLIAEATVEVMNAYKSAEIFMTEVLK
jgi:hypothetical protein